jgi:mRNA interferase MazF
LVRFDPSIGAEIQKERPAVVVSASAVGRLPLHIVVPITDWKPLYTSFPWFVPLSPTATNGLTKNSGADAFQIKSLSRDRFVAKLGNLTPAEMDRIAAAVALCVGYR